MTVDKNFDITKPLWDLNTFCGRWKHYASITNPLLCFVSNDEIAAAKLSYEDSRLGKIPVGMSREQLLKVKNLYESAFHPDTGELQNVFGRMSFQVPGGMAITGAMLQFYRSTTAVIFWQWVNQSFNALANYTNRNAMSPITTTQLGTAYVSATTTAMLVAMGCKSYWGKNANPLLARYVPFAAVAVANCVNIPLMRQNEILKGVDLVDENGNKKTESRFAAVKGISQVVISRIIMCAPGMCILPVIMEKLERYHWMRKIKVFHGLIQVLFCGCFLTVMVPTACAIFPQNCSIAVDTLKRWEPTSYERLMKNSNNEKVPEYLYFNKGL